MKKLRGYFLFIVLFCAAGALPGQTESAARMPLFRNAEWNLSLEKVKENESAYYLQKFIGFGVETISFKDEIAGMDARIDFTFKKDKLTEGAYIINPGDDYRENLLVMLKYLTAKIGKPSFRSGPDINARQSWVKENDYGSYHGASFYWAFSDGFVALISRKFEEDITISVLYAHGSSIARYAENNGVELGEFKVSIPAKTP